VLKVCRTPSPTACLRYLSMSVHFAHNNYYNTYHLPKWFTSNLQHQLHTMRRRYSSSHSPSNLAKFQTAGQNFQFAPSAAKHHYEINFLQTRTGPSIKIFPFSQTIVVFQPQCTTIILLPALIMIRLIQAHLFNEYFLWFLPDYSSSPLSA